jgi:outer membrane protein assembly factor BamB
MKRYFCALALLGWTTLASADDWPGWRGPAGLGTSAEKNLPLQWDRTKNVRWKVPLPAPGNSTPIIWGDRVFITQAGDLKQWPPKVPANYAGGASPGGHAVAEKRSVLRFRRTDGKLLWQGDTVYMESEITHPDNPFCYSSPLFIDGLAVYGSSLFKLGGSGDITTDQLRYRVGSMDIATAAAAGDYLSTLNDVEVPACYEWKTGKELWKDQITERPGGRDAWGSPVCADGRVYVTDREGTTSGFTQIRRIGDEGDGGGSHRPRRPAAPCH